jgi:flagellar hook-length control protein FliK
MDALSLNTPQNVVATSVWPADGTLPAQSDTAGADFAALLALGMTPNAESAVKAQPQEDVDASKETPLDAESQALSTDLLNALPQHPLAQDTNSKAAAPAATPLAQDSTTSLSRLAAADDNRSAAAIADEAANIAAEAERAGAALKAAATAQAPEKRDDAILDLIRASTAEATPGPQSLAHAVHLQSAEGRAPVAQPSALLELSAPVSAPGFADALSRQVVWMVDKDAQIAELRINPPELGPVEVRLTLSNDGAAVQFVSQHAEVREALENALTRLREAMAQAGITLGEASVGAESFSNRAEAQPQARDARPSLRDAGLADEASARSNARTDPIRRGLVDVFA